LSILILSLFSTSNGLLCIISGRLLPRFGLLVVDDVVLVVDDVVLVVDDVVLVVDDVVLVVLQLMDDIVTPFKLIFITDF
jgi:hypothetical protein